MKTPIDQAVDRFLCWKLPEGFCPDNGISFKSESDYGRTKYAPTGTNLFDAQQAKAMLEHVCEPIQAEIDGLRTALASQDEEIDRLTREAHENKNKARWAQEKVAAQRKVLEQALEALQYCVQEAGPCEHECGFCVCKETNAIASIQEVLE